MPRPTRPQIQTRTVSIRLDPDTEAAMRVLDNRLEGFNLSHFTRRAIQHLASQYGYQPPLPIIDGDRLAPVPPLG